MKRGIEIEPPRSIRYGSCNQNDLDLMNAISCYSTEDMKSGVHHMKVLEILNRNADPNAQPYITGPTALLACAQHSKEHFDLRVALLLIQWGADPTVTYSGYTVVDMVENSGNVEAAASLREAIDVYCPWVSHLAEVNYFDRNPKKFHNAFH